VDEHPILDFVFMSAGVVLGGWFAKNPRRAARRLFGRDAAAQMTEVQARFLQAAAAVTAFGAAAALLSKWLLK
jgi:hypothetical protein